MGALSKGCVSCKRKKVKCDEIRPTCTRCRSAGIECTTSAPRLRFVDENPRIQRSVAVSQAQSREFATMTKSSHLAFHSNQLRRYQPGGSALFLANTLPLTAFKDDIFISYLFFKFFQGEHEYPFKNAGDTCVLPKEWIPELVKTSQQPHQKAWHALAAVTFGNAHNKSDVVKNSFKLYGQALSELRCKLSSPDAWRTDSTLASMTALYIYEILASKADRGWMLHANGLGWILESKGPWQQKSCVGKSIFLEHRIMLVAKAIISCQRTFLRDPIWKTVPWEDDPTSKFAIDYLVDIGADIAEYSAQLKTYEITKGNHDLEYAQLRTQVASSLEELNAWWLQWETENFQSARQITLYQENGELLCPGLLEFDSIWTAFTLCTYNVMRIFLLQLWHILQPPPNSIQTTDQGVILDMPNGTALLGITSNTKSLAREILRSLTYCYGKTRRFVNTASFLFIQDIAYGCFEEGSKEAMWAAGHGWAKFGKVEDYGDANLLKRLVPLKEMNARNLILGTGSIV